MQRFPLLLFLCLLFSFSHAEEKAGVAIALIEDTTTYRPITEKMKEELRTLLEEEFCLTFSSPGEFTGKGIVEGIETAIERALNDPRYQIVLATSTLSSSLLAQRKEFSKPSFAPFILSHTLQNLPEKEETSGVPNLNYLTFPTDIARDMELFLQVVPFSHLTFLMRPSSLQAVPLIEEELKGIGASLGVTVEITPYERSVEETLAELPSNTQAVFVLPNQEFSKEQIHRLAQGFIQRQIPSYSFFREGYVDQGILMSMTADGDVSRLAKRLALNIQSVLLGEEAEALSILLPKSEQLVINVYTAEQLCLFPPWKLLLQADQLGTEEVGQLHPTTLLNVVQQGLVENLELAAAKREVLAGQEDIYKARAKLLPQAQLSSHARIINKSRARVSSGREPQRALFGVGSAQQIVYSNELMGSVHVEEHLQDSRVSEYRSITLDTIFDITQAYLNVLRGETLTKIQRNNLRLTEANLNLAKQRVKIGMARASEIYRWESQIAEDRQELINQFFQTKSTRVRLNRLLNLPQNCLLALQNVSTEEPFWILTGKWFDRRVVNGYALELFQQFAVHEGWTLSPEIQQISAVIAAQEEVLGIAKRAYWAPTVSLDADVEQRIAANGAGQSATFPGANFPKTNWQLGVNISYPLLTGGERGAEKRQARQDLLRLLYDREALTQGIEEQIRTAINDATSSFASIGLSESAAASARKNLRLVTESYSKGTTTIVDLLDAQNQSLAADQVAANSVYNFLIDLSAVQRTIGRFDFLVSEEERVAILHCLNSYMIRCQKELLP